MERQVKFFGKIMCSEDSSMIKIALCGDLFEGERTAGGQYKTYIDCIRHNLHVFGLKDDW